MPFTGLKKRARALLADVATLYYAARHERTPWYARILMVAIVAYVFSPVDLIPDFVPVLGYLDELILVPIGISLALKMIPPDVVDECRARARETSADAKREGQIAAIAILIIWIAIATFGIVWFYGELSRP